MGHAGKGGEVNYEVGGELLRHWQFPSACLLNLTLQVWVYRGTSFLWFQLPFHPSLLSFSTAPFEGRLVCAVACLVLGLEMLKRGLGVDGNR